MSLRRNTLWNLAGAGLPLLLGAATIPFLIKNVGVEAFGILTLIWALIGYFSLFDFGLGRALTQQISHERARGNLAEIPALIKSGLLFTTLTGFCGGLLLAGVSHVLATKWLNVSLPLQQSALVSLLLAAIAIPAVTITTGLRGILEAHEEFKDINILRILLGAANFGLPAISVILLGPALEWMVASLIIARLIVTIAHWRLVKRRLAEPLAKVRVERKKLKKLFSFGAWITISNIVSPLMVTADRFVISAVLGASAVAYYTVPFEMLIRLLILPGALTSALFPRLAALIGSGSHEAGAIYRKALIAVAAVMLPLCLAVAAFADFGLSLWLNPDFAAKSWKIAAVLSAGLLLNGIAFVPFAIVQAAGHAHVTAKIHLVELALYIPLLFYGLHHYGLVGAAVVWTVRVGGDLLILLYAAGKYGFRIRALTSKSMV